MVAEDEEPSRGDPSQFPTLRTPFRKDGTVTAATSSPLSDGGAALVLVSEAYLEKHPEITPLAKIVSYGDAAQAPEFFTTSPRLAALKALDKAGLSPADMRAWEVNEAFANGENGILLFSTLVLSFHSHRNCHISGGGE